MTLSTEQLEELAEEAFNEGWRDRESRPGAIINSRAQMRKAWIDSNARDALIAAAANRSTAGFGAEGVDQRGGVPANELRDRARKIVWDGFAARMGGPFDPRNDCMAALRCNEVADHILALAAAPKALAAPDLAAVKELVEAISDGLLSSTSEGSRTPEDRRAAVKVEFSGERSLARANRLVDAIIAISGPKS